ncbi:MAG: tetratricopeptide repeat protein [Polyangiales bacterium]
MRVTLLLFVLVALGGPAIAGTSDGIVVESYVGPRPATAGTSITPLLDELAQRKYSIDQDVSRRYETGVSRTAGTATLPASFDAEVTRGTKMWANGSFSEAVAVLSPLVEAAHAASDALIGNTKGRDALLRALIVLGLSYDRLGDKLQADATFNEVLRSFPTATVSGGTYGQAAAAAFQQTQKVAAGSPKGRLVVQVENRQSEVYINEQLASTGTTAKDLLPGTYRVVVQLGRVRSRTHEVTIKPGADAIIEIDPEFDQVVRTGAWVGFEFVGATQRERLEGTYVAAFAEALQEPSAVVVGIDATPASGAVLFGALILRNGQEVRRARIALSPAPSAERLSALAGFLVGDKKANTAGLDIQLDGTIPGNPGPSIRGPGPGSRDTGGGRWGGWPWLTGVAAVAGLGTGTILLVLDGTCPGGKNDPNCPDLYNTSTPAYLALGGGAVFAAITVYLIVSAPDKPSKTAFVAPTGDGGAVAGIAGRW